MKATHGWTCAFVTLLLSACSTADAPKPSSGSLAESPASEDDEGTKDDADEEDSDSEANDEKDEDKPAKVDASKPSEKHDAGAPAVKDPAVTPPVEDTPTNAAKIVGIDFFKRIVGNWSGITSGTPVGFDFPMGVDITAQMDNKMAFGQFKLDADNNVLWGFNIETYNGKDVLSYRNGGKLFGLTRDSRTQLVEYSADKGFYRFCAVKEHGLPANGCDYLEATYTFSSADKMVFEVKTHGGKPHVHWEAVRMKANPVPAVFPATTDSMGDGSAPWPAEAGI